MRFSTKTSPQRSALFLVVFGVCMISYSGPMVKGALQAGATPIAIALARMASAGLLLLPFEMRAAAKQRISFSLLPSHWFWLTVAAFFLAGHYLTWITSLTGTSTFAAVALVCTQPLFVALFSRVLFRESIPLGALPGAGLALLGAVLIALSGPLSGEGAQAAQSSGQSLGSNLLALLGAVFMAAHWLTARHLRSSLPAQVYTPLLYLITAVLIACCLPLLGPFAMPLAAWPYMAGLVLGSTLLGHALLSRALSHVSAGLVSFALLAEPVGAMVFAALFFHEIPTPWVLAGGALTLVGVCLYLAYETRRREGSPKEASLPADSRAEAS